MIGFDVLWLRWLFIMVVAGLGITLLLFLGFYLDSRRRSLAEQEKEMEEFAGDIRMARGRVPFLLIVVYVGMAVFVVAYVLFVWRGGISY
jgi:hypothetical protein